MVVKSQRYLLKHSIEGKLTVLIVYVNDITVKRDYEDEWFKSVSRQSNWNQRSLSSQILLKHGNDKVNEWYFDLPMYAHSRRTNINWKLAYKPTDSLIDHPIHGSERRKFSCWQREIPKLIWKLMHLSIQDQTLISLSM